MSDISIIPSELWMRIEEKLTLLRSMPPLQEDVIQKQDEELKILHTYYSNAIDGNPLSLSKTESIITRGLTAGERYPPEHLEVVSTAKAFEMMKTLAEEKAPISHATIQAIHGVVAVSEDDSKYRRTNVRGSVKDHPPWTEVTKQMKQLISNVKQSRLHPLETAAYLYHQFIRIHPFREGNGRVARLLVCLYLNEHNYPAVILRKESRKRYTRLVKAADDGDLGPFSAYIAKAVDESLSLFLSAYGGPDELMTTEKIAEYTPYSSDDLRFWAEQGLLDAVQVEHTWYTSRRALERYFALCEGQDE